MSPIPIFANPYDQFHARAKWQYVFLWWPQTCELSNRHMWLCHAYRGTAMWNAPGGPVFEHRYHAPTEHLIWKLRQ